MQPNGSLLSFAPTYLPMRSLASTAGSQAAAAGGSTAAFPRQLTGGSWPFQSKGGLLEQASTAGAADAKTSLFRTLAQR